MKNILIISLGSFLLITVFFSKKNENSSQEKDLSYSIHEVDTRMIIVDNNQAAHNCSDRTEHQKIVKPMLIVDKTSGKNNHKSCKQYLSIALFEKRRNKKIETAIPMVFFMGTCSKMTYNLKKLVPYFDKNENEENKTPTLNYINHKDFNYDLKIII